MFCFVSDTLYLTYRPTKTAGITSVAQKITCKGTIKMKKYASEFNSMLTQILLISVESVVSSFVKLVNLWL